ncbi:HYR domain-containing protein, partial [Synechocystis sp. LEGE 06083]|uniref:HYR domain-containing protein n=1 Tax=Synechocystis sp. LEGE 06083 TaxID=915336 RepID=UPI00187F2049
MVDNQLPTISCAANVTANANPGSCFATVSLTAPTTADNCGVASVTNNAPAQFPIGTTTVTWTVTDNAGNTATCQQTVTVTDAELPTIVCAANVNTVADAGSCFATVVLSAPVTADNCGVASVTNNAPAQFPIGTTTVTWTVTDNNGNTATCQQTVTVVDNQLPTISCAANVTANANPGSCFATVSLTAPTTADNCGVASVTNNAPAQFPIGTTTVTWTVVDNNGNTATCQQAVTVVDNQLPTISCAANVTANANPGSCFATVSLTAPATADNCGVASVSNNAPAQFPIGTTTVTWTVTDNAGNSATCEQTVTVTDAELPTIVCAANVSTTADAGSCFATVVLTAPATADNCGVASVSNNAPAQFPIGTTTVTWTVVDNAGNTATCEQTVTVTDAELPTIVCAADVNTVADAGSCFATVVLTAPATADNCGVASVSNNAPAQFPIGTTTVTWTVVDNAGNSATCQQTVTVTDAELPTIVCAADVNTTADAGSCFATVVLTAPTTADNCGIASVTNNAPAQFPIGTTTVTWTVVDNAGNSATCEQTVTVTDAELPTIVCAANVNTVADAGSCFATVVLTAPATADNCGVASVSNDAPAQFPIGTTTVTWTVTDNAGNSATCEQTVTVTDAELPTIVCAANVTANTNPGSCFATVSLTAPTTADNCGVASVTNNAPVQFPIGTTTVTWTVVDNAGNSATCEQTVTVVDNQLPTISCAANVTANTNPGSCFATVSLTAPTTADNCGVASVTNNAPVQFPIGTTTVTWTVTDNAGNSATCEQTVTVVDNQLPTISCAANVTTTADAGSCFATVVLTAPATADNCGVASVSNNAPVQFPIGTTTVTWTVVDNAGNSATCEQTVTVTDAELPTIVCAANVNTTADAGSCFATVVLSAPATADNCGVASVSNNAPAQFPIGTTTVTWTVTDNAGNAATCEQTVTVTDAELPTIVCAANVNTTVDAGSCFATVVLSAPATADNCGVASVSNNAPAQFPIGTTTVTWTVVDNAGNTATCEQTVTVTDAELPTIVCAADVNTTADAGSCFATVVLTAPAAADNCGVASVINNAPAQFPIGTTTVTWTVVDNAGNSATCEQTVTVTDAELPTITCPADLSQAADTGEAFATVSIPVPSTDDNCAVASVSNSFTGTNDASGVYPLGQTTIVWTVIDIYGNETTCEQTITVSDDQAPEITCPADQNEVFNASCAFILPDYTGLATATDNSDPILVVTQNPAPGISVTGDTLVTLSTTDSNGNTSSCDFMVFVTDATNPTITCPADLAETTDLGSCFATVDLGTPVTADNCGVASVTNNAPAQFPIGTTTVTWTVVDNASNSATCEQTVTVTDAELPTIVCAANVNTVADAGSCFATVVLSVPVTADNCGVASVTNNAPAQFPIGTTTVTWTVVDNNGNSATCEQTVTVTDAELPAIVCAANVNTVADAGSCFATVVLSAPATADNCGVASVSNNAPAQFPIGTTTVTWTVVDNNGNSATCEQTVTVTDAELPTIVCAANVNTVADAGSCFATVVLTAPATADNCGVASVTNNAPAQFPIGTTTVTWTVVDNNGNSATCEQTVTVTDAELPTIVCAADVNTVADAGSCFATVVLTAPATADNCGVASVTNNAPAQFPIGTTTVTWTVVDNAGNSATCEQTVTVVDLENPSIDCPAAISQPADAGEAFATVTIAVPTTDDNCAVASVSNSINGTNDASGTYPLGQTTIVWTVTDIYGNETTCEQIITVADDQAPEIVCPADQNEVFNASCAFILPDYTGLATATDNSDPVLVVTQNPAPGISVTGDTLVTLSTTDSAGNTSSCDFMVLVTDATNPTITCPADLAETTDLGSCFATVDLGTPVTGDNCGVASVTNNAPAQFPIGTTTVTWTVVDNAGNSATCEQTVT